MSFGKQVKSAFAFAIGGILASLIFVALGVGLMIAGYVLRNREQEKPKDEQDAWRVYGGLVLMVLGVVLAGGVGFLTLIGEVSEEI